MTRNRRAHPRPDDALILGVFGDTVHWGDRSISLKDGGACVMVGGKVLAAVSEERLSREKHGTGYERSIEYCLRAVGASADDVDVVAVSNCCARPQQAGQGLPISLEARVVRVASHHHSHALLAAAQSGFDEALVMVADNEGNVLGRGDETLPYNTNSIERISYYLWRHGDLTLLARDAFEPDNIGLGDTYHYITHFLGWSSYTQAGRVMGLAAYGDWTHFADRTLLRVDPNGRIRSAVRNDRTSKIDAVASVLRSGRGTDVLHRLPHQPITQVHMDVAAWAQRSVEEVVCTRLRLLAVRTGVRNMCLSGGLAYNCLLNAAVSRLPEVDGVSVPFAPGDEGQPLGNALWAYASLGGDVSHIAISPYLGRQYDLSRTGSATVPVWASRPLPPQLLIPRVARLLASGAIVGWWQGRSEFGSRALGNRSILADPRREDVRLQLNAKKGRERFRPVAPSVLAIDAHRYFDAPASVPWMTHAARSTALARRVAPAVVHRDGSARLQTVEEEDNPRFFALIRAFAVLTGVPILANTSFNSNGAPIVETPEDAVTAFLAMGLDALVLGDRLIAREEINSDCEAADERLLRASV